MIQDELILPGGYQAAGIAAGIKPEALDLAVIVSDGPTAAAGTFTTNQVCAAPVKWCREQLRSGSARAVVVNAGVANACTGEPGMADAREMTAAAAAALDLSAAEVLVCSTGSIGKRLPMEKIRPGIDRAVAALGSAAPETAAQAIMTTDLVPKTASAEVMVDGKPVRLCGLAKGSGMIEPHMATMLAFLLTDAAVEPAVLQAALTRAVGRSFNRISVDGDQSTNDTVLLLANGQAGTGELKPGHPDWESFVSALDALSLDLALKIVQDGEGATRLITLRVTGAASEADADAAARSVGNSLLVKTGWAGTYPVWGRIMDALGYSPSKIVEDRVQIRFNELPIAVDGVSAHPPEKAVQEITGQPRFTITVDLGVGAGEAVLYTCDCTEEYVRINLH